jgi:hypothetical protein
MPEDCHHARTGRRRAQRPAVHLPEDTRPWSAFDRRKVMREPFHQLEVVDRQGAAVNAEPA